MKIFTVIALYAVSIGWTFAQNVTPKNEFIIELSTNKLETKAGEEKEVTVKLLRSKRYAKLPSSMSVSSMLPDGVNIKFEPATGIMESTQAYVKVDESVKSGTYTIIINCAMNHKNKGSMLKLVINDAAVVNAGL
jgi:hypothetical protein